RAFLSGAEPAPLGELRRRMDAASAAQEYERAASLRDRLGALGWLRGQLDALREARTNGSVVYPVGGHDAGVTWYLIHRGRAAAAVPQPGEVNARREVASLLRALYQPDGAAVQAEVADKVEGVLLVAGWFARYPEERQRVLTPAAALTHCAE